MNTINELGLSPVMYCRLIKKISKISRVEGIGVELGGCKGGVVELMGPDWRGKTTEATIQIIKCLIKS